MSIGKFSDVHIAMPVTFSEIGFGRSLGHRTHRIPNRAATARWCKLLALSGSLLFLANAPASADLKLCNTTSSRIGVVIGYKDDKGWTTEGWWNIPSNVCWTLIKGNLVARYYYIHAIDYDRPGVWDRNETGTGNKSEFFMCTEDKSFVIRGVDRCEERGFNSTRFFEVDTQDEKSWTITLQDKVEKRAGTQ